MQASCWGDRVSVTILRPPLGRTFFLSPVFHCMKNSRRRLNFLRCEHSLEEISPALQANQRKTSSTKPRARSSVGETNNNGNITRKDF